MIRVAVVACLLALALPAMERPARAAAEDGAARTADSLHTHALDVLKDDSVDGRRIAVRDLERATELAPADARHHAALGLALIHSGYDHRARTELLAAVRLDPGNLEARRALMLCWKREWYSVQEKWALDSTLAAARQLVARDSSACDAEVVAAVTLYELGHVRDGAAAAEAALARCPEDGEALLAAAYLAYRTGEASRAEQLFAMALDRLPGDVAARFEDTRPLMSDADADALDRLPAAQHRERLRRFWSASDPDPTTDVNEGLLEYWSRMAHATLLLHDLDRWRWDERTALYARLGAPDAVRFEPPEAPLWEVRKRTRQGGWLNGVWVDLGGGGLSTPYIPMVLEYPRLGTYQVVQDVGLRRDFRLPDARYDDPRAQPSPATLQDAALVSTPGGRAVFPLLPPGMRSLPVAASIATFQGAGGPRLLAQVETPGQPSDSLWADAVVLDSSETLVAHGSVALSPSACDPAERRVAQFAFDVPPGVHRVALSVHDAHGARGLVRALRHVEPTSGALSVSDLVLTCGAPGDMGANGTVRLNPDLTAISRGDDPLVVYFEVYRLTADRDGLAHFEYRYRVRRLDARGRPGSDAERGPGSGVDVRREDVSAASLRRQFVSVPIHDLLPGRYELDVSIRDLVRGTDAVARLTFTRE